jgi:hypothetical protein
MSPERSGESFERRRDLCARRSRRPVRRRRVHLSPDHTQADERHDEHT